MKIPNTPYPFLLRRVRAGRWGRVEREIAEIDAAALIIRPPGAHCSGDRFQRLVE